MEWRHSTGGYNHFGETIRQYLVETDYVPALQPNNPIVNTYSKEHLHIDIRMCTSVCFFNDDEIEDFQFSSMEKG